MERHTKQEIKERILKVLEEHGQLATYLLKAYSQVGYDKIFNECLEELLSESKIEKVEVNKGTYWRKENDRN
ncbi:MAG: hypothetical protein IMZ60_00410 [Actinobacteria bacterium]|nr:hypothetical protein [Actinomycetota bacterium]